MPTLLDLDLAVTMPVEEPALRATFPDAFARPATADGYSHQIAEKIAAGSLRHSKKCRLNHDLTHQVAHPLVVNV